MATAKKTEEGYHPGRPEPARMTAEEFQKIGNYFRDLLADNPFIKAMIIAAGIGGALEGAHIIWLFARYVFRF
jgi:hypothetical protein